ncbi:MAG: TonB-dependent receptor plug domain-containing protein [Holophagaceae bacterium]|nr:TonB-dependent receptor plug domain-containing protein [Holophagaceae bacterium]
MESILLATPGFVADENGRFHFRGSHGQMTYVVDGIPVSDQLHATFSNSLDPSQVESLEVITGGISAEYGGKPVVVVNVTTKSGLGTPNGFEGEVSLGAARFRTAEAGFNARGGTASFGWFVSGAANESDRFLDPVNFENLHNHGRTGRVFSASTGSWAARTRCGSRCRAAARIVRWRTWPRSRRAGRTSGRPPRMPA